jgi:hypothetical protein
MNGSDGLQSEFIKFFVGDDRRLQWHGNSGFGRTVVPLCRKFLQQPDPLLYEVLTGWHERGELLDQDGKPVTVRDVASLLRAFGQWEGAWALRQLHYDQLVKQEVSAGSRNHKGEPACGLAIIARDIGSSSLCRHYASLSSAGDIYFEHRDGFQFLTHGGYGPTMLEQFESDGQQQTFRARVRLQMADVDANRNKPLYLEAFLAARWFGDAHAKRITDMALVEGKGGKPFADVLLDAVEKPNGALPTAIGTRLEAAAGILLSSTPGFEVLSARQTTDEQVDLVVHYASDRLTQLRLPAGAGLVECKSSGNNVASSELRDFGAKCLFHRVAFGILVVRSGITGSGEPKWRHQGQAELVRRRFLADGLTIVVLDISQLRGKAQELRGLQDVLAADHDRLVFGPIAGGT